MRRVILEQDDIRHQPTTSLHPFEEIMAQQMIFRDLILQASLECIYVIDAFTHIVTLTEKILIDIRDGPCIQVDDRIARIDARKEGPVRGGWPHLYARLQNCVPGFKLTRGGVKLRAVQRVCKSTDQLSGTLARQDSIGIQGDDVTDRRQDA